MQVNIASSDKDIEKICSVLLQLRPQYSMETLTQQIQEQRRSQNYQLAYVEQDNQVLCVAGFVMTLKLAWGKCIYIDDLVTDEQHRSTGAGQVLMAWFKSYAANNDCKEIHLDSGVGLNRAAAHKFYLQQGFVIASHHFSLAIK